MDIEVCVSKGICHLRLGNTCTWYKRGRSLGLGSRVQSGAQQVPGDLEKF